MILLNTLMGDHFVPSSFIVVDVGFYNKMSLSWMFQVEIKNTKIKYSLLLLLLLLLLTFLDYCIETRQ